LKAEASGRPTDSYTRIAIVAHSQTVEAFCVASAVCPPSLCPGFPSAANSG